MSFESNQEDTSISPITEAKSLLSNGDVAGAFSVLREAAENGNMIACYDCGFMMMQGIGCRKDLKGGLELMRKGMELDEEPSDMSWNFDKSVSVLFEPQSMDLSCLFLLMKLTCFSRLKNSIQRPPLCHFSLFTCVDRDLTL